MIYRGSVKKMGCEVATLQSATPELHAKAVANVDILYKNAEFEIVHSDSKGRPEIEQVHRVGSLMFDDKTGNYVPVMVTVLEYKDGIENNMGEALIDNIYSVEVIRVSERLNSAGRTAGLTGHFQDKVFNGNNTVPITEFNGIDKKMKPAGQSTDGSCGKNPHVPIAGFTKMMLELLEDINSRSGGRRPPFLPAVPESRDEPASINKINNFHSKVNT